MCEAEPIANVAGLQGAILVHARTKVTASNGYNT